MSSVAEDLKTALNGGTPQYTYYWFTCSALTGSIAKWDTVTDGVTGGTGIVVEYDTTGNTFMAYVNSGTISTNAVSFTSGGTGTVSAIDAFAPSVRLLYDDLTDSHPDDGEIIIHDENNPSNNPRFFKRDENYTIVVEIILDDEETPTELQKLKRLVRYSLDRENRRTNPPYTWDMKYTWAGLVLEGRMDLVISAIKWGVVQ